MLRDLAVTPVSPKQDISIETSLLGWNDSNESADQFSSHLYIYPSIPYTYTSFTDILYTSVWTNTCGFCGSLLLVSFVSKQEPAETEHSRHSQDSHYEDKNSNQKAPDIARESRSGASGACSPPLPKWLELRSADVLQRLLREAQHSQHNQFSKHLQLEQVHQVHLHQVLPSPRVHHIAQSPPCPPPHIHIQESRNHAMSPQCPAAASLAAHLATPGPQAQHPKQLQLWPTAPELQGAQPMQTPALFAQSPPRAKVQPLLEPQQPQLRQHAKSMPEASQVHFWYFWGKMLQGSDSEWFRFRLFFSLCFLSGYLDVQLTQADTVKDLIEQLQQWPGSSIVCDSDRWPPDPLDLFFTNASSIVINAPKCGFAWVCLGLPLLFYGCGLLAVGLSCLLLPLHLPQHATATVRWLRIPGASISGLNVPFGSIWVYTECLMT